MHVQGQPQIRHMTCSTEPYGITAKFGLHNKPVNAMWEFSKVITFTTDVPLNLVCSTIEGFHCLAGFLCQEAVPVCGSNGALALHSACQVATAACRHTVWALILASYHTDMEEVCAGARCEGDSTGAAAQHQCHQHGLSFTAFGETIPINEHCSTPDG